MRVLDLFSGLGAFSLGLERAGMKTVAFCENDPFCQKILRSHWPHVPIFDDITTLKAIHVGPVDFICGGFPCTDASVANTAGLGTAGERTGLFAEAIRLARDLRPRGILMENVPELLNRGFGDVLAALAKIRFDAEWDCLSARALGAPHERERLWILAYPSGPGLQGSQPLRGALGRAKAALAKHSHQAFGEWRSLVTGKRMVRGVDGATVTMERRRIHAAGNSLYPDIPEIYGREILASAQRSDEERLRDTALPLGKSLPDTNNILAQGART